MYLYAYSATERGIRERRQRAPACLPAPEPVSEPVAAPAPPAPEPDNVVSLVIPKTNAQQIISDVAQQHGLTYADLMSHSRKRNLVAARYDAIAAVKNAKPMFSLEQLGRLFQRDYSSIRYALVQRGLA